MASTSSYIQQMMSSSGITQKTLAEILAEIGGTTNVAQDTYTPAEKIAVTQPQLMTIAEYLDTLGATGAVKYDYDEILNLLNAASAAGQEAQQNELAQTAALYNRQIAEQQNSAVDTIRNLSAQAIQSGISKGMQNANILSSILGTSQSAAEGAQELAAERVQAAKDYAAELAGNATSALTQSNNEVNTLLSNIRQLYNDDIQQKTADLEYNASIEESIANYLANKYSSDTNYAAQQNSTAGSIYSNLQSAIAAIAQQAAASEAQDNYSAAYLAAQQAAASSYNSGYSSSSSSSSSSGSSGTTGTTSSSSSGVTAASNAASAGASALSSATKSSSSSSTTSSSTTSAAKLASNASSSTAYNTALAAAIKAASAGTTTSSVNKTTTSGTKSIKKAY